LHKELAKELNIESFRVIDTIAVDSSRKGETVASWLDRKCSSTSMDSATAQVTPLELTQKLLAAAVAGGAEYMKGIVDGIKIEDNVVKGVSVSGEGIIAADKVVICAGPWSGVMAEDYLGINLPMEGIKSTSLVYANNELVRQEPVACFCAEDEFSCHLELYPRPNGDVYICGCGGSDYVSGDRFRAGGDCSSPELIQADPARVAAAQASFKKMSSIGDRTPDVTQACMRPCPSDGLPCMGSVAGIQGAYISAGHNCWGILWAPVSGKAMAEVITKGVCSVLDIAPFNPSRFMPSRRGVRGRKRGSLEVGEQW
jgi:glycine/D-amino acid oxidase-like deaminating enzyme